MTDWREDKLVIGSDFIVEDDGKGINAYIETWFDIEEKFGVDIPEGSDEWLNLYATYRPDSGGLTMEYVISRPDNSESHVYKPTDEEKALVIRMIHEASHDYYGCSPQEFIDNVLARKIGRAPPPEFQTVK